jgi:hypothetical protein
VIRHAERPAPGSGTDSATHKQMLSANNNFRLFVEWAGP